ncbi:DUF1634 domain-containing protein [Luteibacter aegosomaticola]|uniref:DUF1634 domain-containing protein n=1 Tax=Luteibacter aegosomaticola TaxID=2911538 RepID=UPI001FFAC27D|nr:DUF1634 domain-containing protein [Luteibacter aegosomaticola]UPG90547.1 DUF1634 domain-containing protein [Luteibacter aegosomaticola]
MDGSKRGLAHLYWLGTCMATTVLLAGMVTGMADDRWSHQLSLIGIAMFSLLPVTRVAWTLVTFIRIKDYPYVACSAGVLLVIGAGVALEVWLPGLTPG